MSDENYFMRFSQLRDDVRHLQYDVNDKLKELEDENKKLRQYLGKYDEQVSYYKSELAGSWLYLAEEVKQCLKELEK